MSRPSETKAAFQIKPCTTHDNQRNIGMLANVNGTLDIFDPPSGFAKKMIMLTFRKEISGAVGVPIKTIVNVALRTMSTGMVA